MKTLFIPFCAAALAFTMAGFAQAQVGEDAQTVPVDAAESATEASDLLSVMKAQGEYTWFVEKLEQTGLAQDLQNGGPYTVFAPTDMAVEASKAETEKYDAEKPDPRLIQTLRFHMTPGSITLEQLKTTDELTTVGEDKLSVVVDGDVVQINGAQIVSPGLTASNGIIHGIDALLTPPSESMSAIGTGTSGP